MTAWHDDDILGKAYDARLMRRFLGYVRPIRQQIGQDLQASCDVG